MAENEVGRMKKTLKALITATAFLGGLNDVLEVGTKLLHLLHC